MIEIGSARYDSSIYHDENTLLNFKLLSATQLNQHLTYLWGHDSDKFPLLSMTEGQLGKIEKRAIGGADTQYKWKIMGRNKLISQVKKLITTQDANGKVGANYAPIIVEMADNWFPYQYGAIAPDGVSLAYISTEGQPTGNGTFRYTWYSQTAGGINASNFAAGKFWAMSAPIIPASKSEGTRDNKRGYNEATNQYGLHRFSMNIAGNVANKVLDIQFSVKDADGKMTTTNKWIPFVMKDGEIQRKQLLEENLWRSRYNRSADGSIGLKEKGSNEPIPTGAGIFEQIEAAGNGFTYPQFTKGLLDMIHDHVHANRIGDSVSEKIIYCGKGFAREFARTMERDAKFNQYFNRLGEANLVSGKDGYLRYGAYIQQYKLLDGTIFSLQPVHMFDHGSVAEMQKANGETIDGLPLDSFTGVCLDHSSTNTEDGISRNVQMVYEEGREFMAKVYAGVTNLPPEWGVGNVQVVSSTKDIASYEIISSQGINILNPTTSFYMKRG